MKRAYPKYAEAIRKRLIAIRRTVAGDNQTAFARYLGIESNHWNNLEHPPKDGKEAYALTMDLALLLVEKINGLTVGYITQGHTDRLSKDLVRRLKKFDPEIF